MLEPVIHLIMQIGQTTLEKQNTRGQIRRVHLRETEIEKSGIRNIS